MSPARINPGAQHAVFQESSRPGSGLAEIASDRSRRGGGNRRVVARPRRRLAEALLAAFRFYL